MLCNVGPYCACRHSPVFCIMATWAPKSCATPLGLKWRVSWAPQQLLTGMLRSTAAVDGGMLSFSLLVQTMCCLSFGWGPIAQPMAMRSLFL